VFLWLLSGNKRVAYQRIPARSIVYSMVEEEKGEHCGAVQTIFLKVRQQQQHLANTCDAEQ
jgi:hypothetical protein